MLLAMGIFGVLVCLASVVLLGTDISAYINSGLIPGGAFKLTNILEVMRKWTPELWTTTVNYINGSEPSFQKTFTEFAVSLPATVIGLMIGIGLVMVGFRVERYYKD